MAKPKAATMTRATKNGALHARQNNTAGDWFRVGILSATVVAPLMARWNELRVAERAKALSSDLRALAVDRSQDLKKLAGSRIEDARQQFLATKAYEKLKDKAPALAKLDNRKQARRAGATGWLVGAGIGVILVGVV